MLDTMILGRLMLGAPLIHTDATDDDGDSPPDTPVGHNLTGQILGTGDRSGLHVRCYDTATGALLLSLTTDADGHWSGQLDHPDPFTLLITDPSHQHSPVVRGPYRLTQDS
jgi:hypothetical protein